MTMTTDDPRKDVDFRVGPFLKWSAIALSTVIVLGVLAARVFHALGID